MNKLIFLVVLEHASNLTLNTKLFLRKFNPHQLLFTEINTVISFQNNLQCCVRETQSKLILTF
jgi:hypothetical protein